MTLRELFDKAFVDGMSAGMKLRRDLVLGVALLALVTGGAVGFLLRGVLP